MTLRTSLLALGALACACVPALAQTATGGESAWGKPADLKPLLPPIIPPVLPPNSVLTPGSLGGEAPSPYSANPGYDAARAAPAPGLRITIPAR